MSNSAKPDVATTAKQRPFPWRCAECGADDVVPAATDYTGQVNCEGRLQTVDVPGIEIPTCRRCGERVFTNRVEEQINAAFRAQLHLLTPGQITAAIHALGMETDEIGRRLGIREETLSAWISGAVIQSRAMDDLLRAYFASSEVRAALLGSQQDPQFGVLPVPAAR